MIFPYSSAPYEEQLRIKETAAKKSLREIVNQLKRECKQNPPEWVKRYYSSNISSVIHRAVQVLRTLSIFHIYILLLLAILRSLSYNDPCCSLEPIRPSPIINGYRNKVSFTIGEDTFGKPCVGFSLGRMEDNMSAVGVIPYHRYSIYSRTITLSPSFDWYIYRIPAIV